MEKVVAALWRKGGESREVFNLRLLNDLPGALAAAGASAIRLNLRDDVVGRNAFGFGFKIQNEPVSQCGRRHCLDVFEAHIEPSLRNR